MSASLADYDYELPTGLVAEQPAAKRSASRLLALDRESGLCAHRRFAELPELLSPDDLLVFNDTRVIRARLRGHKHSGGKVEALVERILPPDRALARLRASKSPRAGGTLRFMGASGGIAEAEVVGRAGELFELQFGENPAAVLGRIGEVPLPPYIRRPASEEDAERYQTVYASREGAVAAPTAGLHFDEELLGRIRAMGVASVFVTLHVGAGTFQPVREADIRRHRMHSEVVEVFRPVCDAVADCRARGGRVIAVGTTVVRALESAAAGGSLNEFQGETDIFIYPGFRFLAVDALITNFHLPRSSLLMLVSAFCGSRQALLNAYREAIAHDYRFYSYGDAMFISGNAQNLRGVPMDNLPDGETVVRFPAPAEGWQSG